MESKYIKVIESLGEVISKRDLLIKEQLNEIEKLKRKIEMIEEYMNYYDKNDKE